MTIKEYAKTHGISYEAVRKQLTRYCDELRGHITTNGQTKYLDDYAIEFLDQRRRSNPVVVLRQGEREETDLLREQIEALRNELMTTQKRVIELQSENQLMLEAKVKYELLVESNEEKKTTIEALREDLKSARDDADQIRKERDAAQADAKSYRKSIFGFYRKISG